jgi:hypothetical protein
MSLTIQPRDMNASPSGMCQQKQILFTLWAQKAIHDPASTLYYKAHTAIDSMPESSMPGAKALRLLIDIFALHRLW